MASVSIRAMDTSELPKLPRETLSQIQQLCDSGDECANQEQISEAFDYYWEAWDLLPEPQYEWDCSMVILGSIGDLNFACEDYEAGRDNLIEALKCAGALGNPFLHLRLGQCHFELNEMDKANVELRKAYNEGGAEIFEDEESKFFELVQAQLAANPGLKQPKPKSVKPLAPNLSKPRNPANAKKATKKPSAQKAKKLPKSR
jgi:tetratricopeptide (TPR) repeat protein